MDADGGPGRDYRHGADSALALESDEQFAASRSHGGCAGARQGPDLFDCAGLEPGILLSEIGKPLHSERLDDRTLVLQIDAESVVRALAFFGAQAEARDHDRQMPSQFLLYGFVGKPEEFLLVRLKQLRIPKRGFFGGIGRAHADHGVFIPKAFQECVLGQG